MKKQIFILAGLWLWPYVCFAIEQLPPPLTTVK